ncbi:MAG: 2,3,4,5-tetrahydropyridine-2,6-dicarboxylate N-succinyltransferase [Gammaproteobacteria bacterium RIFCSPHIGHO2_02_FULL_39_13]|nr:MAG: 2,3,4,5-tetrahydropyridine-2,6-dicarboxylate N-succinyltransferase [Gammaproteobacteria bacterium RIFCSPHIGHO2_02_FULL_39_13]OGT49187.1 MAG: 2,3,4,5-tetrahydropyridine-2,6-dicarboxylate N-succinyltransferase [Gammaproteobacteria bacterium RIFCSPHIGHO2_12_FULL_39_24]
MISLQNTIENAFNIRDQLSSKNSSPEIRDAIQETIDLLDTGKIRVAEKINGKWVTHEWIKKTILLFFKTQDSVVIHANYTQFFDKVPLKFSDLTEKELQEKGVRIVPNAVARKGSYIAFNTVLMPSFINIGAYIDSGTLIDTWSTVGSCAQIGKNVHISGGVGIGGVLEPLQSTPTIIEDNCFIGARSEMVEGIIVEEGSVISMGVFIGQSTPIYNRATDEVTYGKIPAYSVVIPGSLPSENGQYTRYCALIMKQVDEKTRAKTSINELLRN